MTLYPFWTIDSYTLTVLHGSGGDVVNVGARVAIAADTAIDGWQFAGWEIVSGGGSFEDATSPQTTYHMPANAATVEAKYEKIVIALERIRVFDRCEMVVGESLKLAVTFQPAGTNETRVAWTSDNPTAATVNRAGKVTAHNPGTAKITATSTAHPGIFASCVITVTEASAPLETSAPIDKVTLGVGKTWDITALYGGAYAWTSDAAVAVVDDHGRVTGIGEGTATVTVIASSGVKATAKIKVTGEGAPPTALAATSIAISPGVRTQKVGEAIRLDLLVTPFGAAPGLTTWTSDNTAVATVDATGLVTAIGKGKTTITALEPVSGLKAKCKVTVK